VVLGVALRLFGIRHGLPDFVEEAAPFRWALDMWAGPGGAIDWNPHHFIYPSLVIYLHLALQRLTLALGGAFGAFARPADYRLQYVLDPGLMVIVGRLLTVAADAVTIAAVVRIGERWRRGAGWVAGAIVACSPLLIRTSRSIFTDPVMAMFAVLALERMLRYRSDPGRADGGRVLLTIAVLIGLAAGSKYPAIVLLLPFAWILISRHGPGGGAWRGALALPVVAGTFLLTTPYALLDTPTFLRDLRFDANLAGQGILGGTGAPSGWSTLVVLVAAIGPVAAVLAALGALLAIRRVGREPEGGAVLLFALGLLLPVLISPLRFDRYLVGVLPAVALLAGVAAATITAWAIGSERRWIPQVLGAVILVPALGAAVFAAGTGIVTTQMLARQWCFEHLRSDQLLVQEQYGARLSTVGDEAVEPAVVERASPAMRKRYRERRTFASVLFPLSVAGPCTARLRGSDGLGIDVEVFPHASDFNQVVYDRRLLAGVDLFLVSAGTRGRFEADPARYPVECAFYRELDSTATPIARFIPTLRVNGPEIAIYRLPPIDPSLPRWWWTDRIPQRFRDQANAVLAPSAASNSSAIDARGAPAPWVCGMRELYRKQLSHFCSELAGQQIALGRYGPARALMAAQRAILPGDMVTGYLMARSERGEQDLTGARATLEQTIARLPRSQPVPEALETEYRRVMALLDEQEPQPARRRD
jgi:hypothetical protein